MRNEWVMDEWKQATSRGIAVEIDGVSYENKSTQELRKVLQKGSYMLDYEANPLGEIIAIHIDRV